MARAAAEGPASVFEIEPHGERRRRQFVEVAAHLIETEGPEAVRMPRVAKLAGCTRTLVYRYFPAREDLLFAVLESFYDRFGERVSAVEHAEGMAGLSDPDSAVPPSSTIAVFEAIWDTVTELGMAGIILRETANLSSDLNQRFRDYLAFQERWHAPLRESGLSEIEACIVVESANRILRELISRWRAGEIEKDEAIRLGYRSLRGLVSGLQQVDPEPK